MLIERTASKKRQKVLLIILLVVVAITGVMLYGSRSTTDATVTALRPLPRTTTVVIPQRTSRSIVTDPLFQRLEAVTGGSLEIGGVGRVNPFVRP